MRRFFSLILASMVLFNLNAYAQQVHIDIEASGFRKMKVAMPTYAGPGDMAGSVWAMCARDLALTGLFDVISPQSYVNPGPLGEVQQGSLKDFSLIGSDYVIAATVQSKEPQACSRYRWWKSARGRSLRTPLLPVVNRPCTWLSMRSWTISSRPNSDLTQSSPPRSPVSRKKKVLSSSM